ncbi:MAG: hypothetical protein ACLFPD_06140 [Desulfosudaceae bacterium]
MIGMIVKGRPAVSGRYFWPVFFNFFLVIFLFTKLAGHAYTIHISCKNIKGIVKIRLPGFSSVQTGTDMISG